jgi:hypothetical protein
MHSSAKMLGKESPEQLAHGWSAAPIWTTQKCARNSTRAAQGAIASSTDPMIRFAASIDDELLAVRKDYEARVDAPTRAAAEKIAKARFAIYGTSVDPDATFTPRLSFGTVKGFEDAEGKFVRPTRPSAACSSAPPERSLTNCRRAGSRRKASLNLSTPMNLSTTNDIIGGNSGSPLIDKNAKCRRPDF